MSESQISRRKFLSTVSLAVGTSALGLPDRSAEAGNTRITNAAGRTGISKAAYLNARQWAQTIVSKMTLKQKIAQLGMHAGGIQELNLPSYCYRSGEAVHGVAFYPEPGDTPVTSFPVPLAMAASWNPDLFLRVYTAVSDEARAYDNKRQTGLSFFSPLTLNLHRDPRWGRSQEAPGEDPCLAATLAVQVVRGMQGDNPDYLKTTACSKHFVCNNTENDRRTASATVTTVDFWEYYSRAYRATVQEGDVFTFMGAYNSVNGVPCCASHFLMTEALRDRWGFSGYVISDCDAIENIFDTHHYAPSKEAAAAMAVLAGCDSNCGETLTQNLMEAVDQKLITEPEIDIAAIRVLTVLHLLGLFDPSSNVPYKKIPIEVVNSEKHRNLALEAARQSLVLLKNQDNFLPLEKSTLKNVAVIGPLGKICYFGEYTGTPSVHISPFRGIASALGVKVYQPFVTGEDIVNRSHGLRTSLSDEGEMAMSAIQTGNWAEFPEMDFTGKMEFQARVLSPDGAATIEVHLDTTDGPLACKLQVPHELGKLWKDVEAPLLNISGPHKVFLNFNGGAGRYVGVERFQLNPVSPPPEQGRVNVLYRSGCSVTGNKDDRQFDEAVRVAQRADLVVLVCGVNSDVDRESKDRSTLGLTGVQPELIQAVYQVNPKTVLVLNSNNTVAVNWEQEHLPAILCALCAGQAQGTAIAEALFGDYNPGGKLPCTWYRSTDQLSPFSDYDIRNGRTYLYFEGEPLYPFGYGLSYTQFKLGSLTASSKSIGPGEKVKLTISIVNTGRRAGTEVVQLYIVPPISQVKRPKRQLAGFQRVELQMGQEKAVEFEIPYNDPTLWYWDEAKNGFVMQPGVAKLLIGDSSVNILQTCEIELKVGINTLMQSEDLGCTAVRSRIV